MICARDLKGGPKEKEGGRIKEEGEGGGARRDER